MQQHEHENPHRGGEVGETGRGMSHIDQRAQLIRPSTFDTQFPTGGQRSLANMQRLGYLGQLGRLMESVEQTITDLWWSPASSLAIERQFPTAGPFTIPGAVDSRQQVWYAGHTSALLVVDPFVIAASQTGGVWLVNYYPEGFFRLDDSHPAICLSDEWDNPDVTCLAFAPGVTDQFYAGCVGSGALYLVELQPVLGGRDRKRSTIIPLPFLAGVQQIVVLEGSRRIVLACDSGVYWSPIPAACSDASGYFWQAALGLPDGIYSGLAEGPGQTVVAAARGANATSGHYGIFRGQWEGSDLVFSRSAIQGVDQTQMLRTSVASCEAQRSVLYAVAAGGEEAGGDYAILAVLTSHDGGNSWTAVAKPPSALSGFQGNYNNVIAVSPVRPNVVVLGWRKGGPFFSTDGGQTWTLPRDDESLHSDLHALYFARHADAANTDWLFVGSDGGVIDTRDLGHSYESEYSKHLRTLQFSTGPYTMTLTASSHIAGLIAGGTQDNGNLFCYRTGDQPRWYMLQGGDGALNRMVDTLGTGALLFYNNSIPPTVRIAFWSKQTESFGDNLNTVVPVDGDKGGLPAPWLEVVRAPSWRRGGKLMYAVAGTMNSGVVYGLFSSPDGSDAQFSRLADVGNRITALDSHDGTTVLIASTEPAPPHSVLVRPPKSHLLLLDAEKGTITDLTPPPAFHSSTFTRVAILEPHRAFALGSNGQLLRYDGSGWHETAGSGFVVFEADPSSQRIFAATDTSVFVSSDDGASWAKASRGLPSCPHCLDLRMAADGKGGHVLYLATHGRSVWWAQIDFVQGGPHIPAQAADILAGILGDGGGIIRVGGHLIPIPPRGPVIDILGALAIEEIASSMSEAAGQSIRIAAMNTVRSIAEAQIRALEHSR